MSGIVNDMACGLLSADIGERARAVQDLGWTRSATAAAPLRGALSDDSSEVRLRAAQSLAFASGDDEVIDALTNALEDPIAEVRSTAARSLDQIRNPGQSGAWGGSRGFRPRNR
jgi:HEAT repeat protein